VGLRVAILYLAGKRPILYCAERALYHLCGKSPIVHCAEKALYYFILKDADVNARSEGTLCAIFVVCFKRKEPYITPNCAKRALYYVAACQRISYFLSRERALCHTYSIVRKEPYITLRHINVEVREMQEERNRDLIQMYT